MLPPFRLVSWHTNQGGGVGGAGSSAPESHAGAAGKEGEIDGQSVNKKGVFACVIGPLLSGCSCKRGA